MQDTLKTCTKCKISKSIAEFSKDSKRLDNLQLHCKKCHAEYRKNNIKAKLEHNKLYKLKYPEKFIEYNKRYRIKNRHKIAAAKKEYQTRNSDKRAALCSKYRSRKLNASPKWLTEEHWKSIKGFYTLAKQLSERTGIIHHVDHIHPLKGQNSCGLHVPWNLQVIPASENIKKYNKIKV